MQNSAMISPALGMAVDVAALCKYRRRQSLAGWMVSWGVKGRVPFGSARFDAAMRSRPLSLSVDHGLSEAGRMAPLFFCQIFVKDFTKYG